MIKSLPYFLVILHFTNCARLLNPASSEHYIPNDVDKMFGDDNEGSNGTHQTGNSTHHSSSDCSVYKKEIDDYNLKVNSHIRRYIRMFLRNTNLFEEDLSTKSNNEEISKTVSIIIQVKNLKTLRKVFTAEIESLSLQEVDDIFSELFPAIQEKFVQPAKFGEIFGTLSFFSYFSNYDVSIYQIALFIVIVGCLISCFFIGMRTSLISAFVGFLFVESAQAYFNKIKEVEIEKYRRLVYRMNVPPQCDPSKQSIWESTMSWLFGDECEKMLKDEEITADSQVSFLNILLDKALHFCLDLPFKRIGSTVHVFATEISGRGAMGTLLYFVFLIIACIAVFSFLLVILGFDLRISTLLGSLQIFSSSDEKKKKTDNSAPSHHLPLQHTQSAPIIVNVNMPQNVKRRRSSRTLPASTIPLSQIKASDASPPSQPTTEKVEVENGDKGMKSEGVPGAQSSRLTDPSSTESLGQKVVAEEKDKNLKQLVEESTEDSSDFSDIGEEIMELRKELEMLKKSD